MLERVSKIVENNKDFFRVEENPNIQTLCSLDPTPNKKYINWILNQFKAHRIKEEDYYKFNELLGKFHSGKHKLPVKDRNINKFNSINSLFSVVNQIPTSKNEENKLDKERAYQESILHCNQNRFKVIEPLTEFASCFWGKGTNWCTASTSSKNYFEHYTKDENYILIIITPKGDKYQIYSGGDFCDSSDNDIYDIAEILKKIPIKVIYKVEKLFKALLFWKFEILKHMKNLPLNLVSIAVEFSWVSLKYIDGEFQTEESCAVAIKQDIIALNYVVNQTPYLCLLAVKKDGLALEYVKDQTEEICLAAVKKDGLALEYVKDQTPKICLAAVKKDGFALQYVKSQTPEICLAAVKQNGWALQCVKDQTLEICKIALRKERSLYFYVSEEFQKYFWD